MSFNLGHFVLTLGLLNVLEKSIEPRVVVLSSLVAKMSKADIYWNDLQFEKSYDKMVSYSQSKSANMMFGLELNKKLGAKGSKIKVVLAHPGYTATNLQTTYGTSRDNYEFLHGSKS
ncbi:MAG: hypothetical protein GY827_03425 [Cytophagales bacterium]|nr:hypothetical protein [Cytophagales bacterium]